MDVGDRKGLEARPCQGRKNAIFLIHTSRTGGRNRGEWSPDSTRWNGGRVPYGLSRAGVSPPLL